MANQNSNNTEKNNNVITSREDFLNAIPDPKVEKRWVESLGMYLFFKELSGVDQDSYEAEMVNLETDDQGNVTTNHNLKALKAKFLVRSLCDENGVRFFKDEEYKKLGSKFSGTLNELHDIAQEVNGVTKSQLEVTKKK